MVNLNEVFGVSSNAIKSYFPRGQIDGLFNEAIASDKHVVVYGASKQGKTALVSRYLSYEENVVVRLAPKSTVEDIYASILRQAGVSIEVSSTSENAGKIGGNAGAKFKAKIPLIGEAEFNGGGSGEASQRDAIQSEAIPFNISVPQDVSELLHKVGFRKKVILENFHYLDDLLQKQISFDLRLYQEMGILFVILGVWRQKDKLRIYCSDLTDRVIDVPVEPWEDDDFREVAALGAKEMNAEIDPKIVETCVGNSFGSIGVFQELMREVCEAAGLKERRDVIFGVYGEQFAEQAIQKKSEQYGATHRQALEQIASGNITHSKEKALQPLHLPYYLVRSILDLGYDGFEHGVDRSEITERVKSMHHRKNDVRPGDMTNLLHNLSGTQHKKGINPPLIDYDQSKRRLFAIDSTFFFFLKNCDLAEFAEELPSPLTQA
ncbi:hypothetical protein [Leisingera sp. M658]|uniref:hypothetical protein n=1 Tax=Leisingera sp. M658 TaxID=2867015 RepID=UPI0021A4EC01|nr:hypothetical protein [Leisingera sp. M658]UWQ77414.1 hypothetical protein K3724_23075 [Leisingera sp. M658]